MAYTPQFIPQPFGNVLVPTPGTPVRISSNFPNLTPPVTGSVTDPVPCNKMNFIASPITHGGAGNTGSVYVGTATMVRATLVGVLVVIPKGGSLTITHNVGNNIYPFEKLYVDADTANDGLYGFIDTI